MKIKKITAVMLAAGLSVSLFSGFSADKSEELVLYTWEGMFPPEVLEGFEEGPM